MNENKVSIAIINYFTYDMVDDCIHSIKKFTQGVDYEIVVVDNETTASKLDVLVKKYPEVKFIPSANNIGFSAANNLAVKECTGKYLLILNNDTLFLENTLLSVKSQFDSLNEECIIGCKLLNSDMSLQESALELDTIMNCFGEAFFLYKIFKRSALLSKYHLHYKKITELTRTGYVKGAFMFMLKKTYERFGGFDERFHFYAEELDLCNALNKENRRVLYYPATSIIHLGGATTDLMPWFKFRNQQIAQIMFYQKNYPPITKASLILIYEMGVLTRVCVYSALGLILFRKSFFIKAFYFLRRLFVYPKNLFIND